jgi:acyl carrier protein
MRIVAAGRSGGGQAGHGITEIKDTREAVRRTMNTDIYDEIAQVLTSKFQVDPARVQPDATLESLGLDSLTLMEFVFALEDHFSVRVPEDKLDPRQAGVTLEHLAGLLDDELSVPPASSAQPA